MTNKRLDFVDYSFFIGDAPATDEDWMHDPEVAQLLADIDAEFPEEVYE